MAPAISSWAAKGCASAACTPKMRRMPRTRSCTTVTTGAATVTTRVMKPATRRATGSALVIA
jgi:hypothetical protein